MMLRLASSISAWPRDQRICESRLNWAIVRPGGRGRRIAEPAEPPGHLGQGAAGTDDH
jgi:hypothetical protein